MFVPKFTDRIFLLLLWSTSCQQCGISALAPSGLPYCWCNGVLNFHTAPLLAFAKLPGVIKFTVAIATLQLYPCYSSAACAPDKQLITEEYNTAIFKAYLKIQQPDFSVFFFLHSSAKIWVEMCVQTLLGDSPGSSCIVLPHTLDEVDFLWHFGSRRARDIPQPD